VAKKTRAFAPQTIDAAQVLGAQIAQARRARGWTAAELAERVGVSVRTISNLEHGSPTVAMGVAFEAATMLGISLFGVEGSALATLARRGRDTLALLPARVYRSREPVRDDF
jgi:transcriptional regulator with XRE-family HTH domain